MKIPIKATSSCAMEALNDCACFAFALASQASGAVGRLEWMRREKMAGKIACARVLSFHAVCDGLPQSATVEDSSVVSEAPLQIGNQSGRTRQWQQGTGVT